MKINKLKIFFLLFSLLQLSFSACKDNNDNPDPVDIVIENSKIFLSQGQTKTVKITSGNGDYTATTSNENVITAHAEGNEITITAVTQEDKANAMVVITDKYYKRTYIEVIVTKLSELDLDKNSEILILGSTSKAETIFTINSGNGGYRIEYLEDAQSIVTVDTENIEENGIFTVKALATGMAKLKLTDHLNKEAIIDIKVVNPVSIEVDKYEITLNAVQGNDVIKILSTDPGKYSLLIENKNIIKASLSNNEIHITGKKNGSTTITVLNNNGCQSQPIPVTVNGPRYAMNLSDQYFGYANFKDIALVDNSIRSCKQVTFEMSCKITGYRGLQTFMGLEGKLIIRGKNDDYKDTHPIEIAGLGDNIMLESTSSFNLNEWMHIALVVDCEQSDITNKYKLYINGRQDVLKINRNNQTHTSVDLASSTDGDRFEIGRAFGDDWRCMRGVVSEARVWTVARSSAQINDNMWNLQESTPTGLLAHWDFTAGVATNYIQDINGGKYETNLYIANAKESGSYTLTTAPANVFVDKPSL